MAAYIQKTLFASCYIGVEKLLEQANLLQKQGQECTQHDGTLDG